MLEAVQETQEELLEAPEYLVFSNLVPKEQCQEILDYANSSSWKTAETVAKDVDTSKRQRQSDIIWCTKQKFFNLANGLVNDANKYAGWNFKIDTMESLQITRYKTGGFFEFHSDGNGVAKMPNMNKVRKLSLTIILNDDFEGGEFEFHNNHSPIKENGVGTAIVFPSYLVHRVRPITKGTRYSLVSWFCGEPFV